MSSEAMEILDPVKTDGLKWPVKEMNWRDGMAFLGLIGKHASEIGIESSGGKVALDFAKLPALIGNVKELGDFLLTKSTGREQAEIDALSFKEAVALMDAAVELNLSEELLQRGKSVAGRVGAAFGVKKESPGDLGDTVDFLVWQGHSWEEIREYTLRQLDLFTRKASERLKTMYSSDGGRSSRGGPPRI
jgi:hypothetical protein